MTDHALLHAITDKIDQKIEENFQPINQGIAKLKQTVRHLETDISGLDTDITDLKNNAGKLKTDISELKADMADLKTDITKLSFDISELRRRVLDMDLNFLLETQNRQELQLLTEHHAALVRRLNQASFKEDRSALQNIQISGFKYKLEDLEKEIEGIKGKLNCQD